MRTDANGQVILSFPLFFVILFLGVALGWLFKCEYQAQANAWHETHKARCAYSDVRGYPYVTCEPQAKHWFFQ